MSFELIGPLWDVETIAIGNSIREIRRLRKFYGGRRWRKMKGVAKIRLSDGKIERAEVHWYEGHGIGRKEIKIKRLISEG